MISAQTFCDELRDHGIDFVTGVPCSFFSGPISRLTREGRYFAAPNEGSALALAAGASAAGVGTAVLSQNSGLGNQINPLTSLNMTYRVPTLVFMSLRGWPDPAGDEPQHAVMGETTMPILDTLGVAHQVLTPGTTGLKEILAKSLDVVEQGRSAFVLVQRGSIGTEPGEPAAVDEALPTRSEVLRRIVPRFAGLPVIATTGYTSRDLFAAGDADTHFYMQGSMGHALSFGLGVALHQPERKPVLVLDGDGAALMHLGSMSAVGAAAPDNLIHLVFDNRTYESTGCQLTTSATTDFAALALACGYATASTCRSVEETEAALASALERPGPHFVVAAVAPNRGAAPPRATSAVSAPEIFTRFAGSMNGTSR
ncbi:phosphonopyruvate decarboxylase [Kitasatospora sp. NPDC101157]|uniref:phosphonopyruvate decarboxylase n=1 Tax=Kitasatospora sp. NPDC101157 TaxID=3364098 RepID=UPI003816AD4C